jgi:hypothetical protein
MYLLQALCNVNVSLKLPPKALFTRFVEREIVGIVHQSAGLQKVDATTVITLAPRPLGLTRLFFGPLLREFPFSRVTCSILYMFPVFRMNDFRGCPER